MEPDRPLEPDAHAASHRRWRPRLGVLPGPCEICRQWSREPFCGDCLQLYRAPVPRCERCALPLRGAVTCGACLHEPPPFVRAIAAVDYAFPWDRVIRDLKFRSRTELARPLAEALAHAVHEAHGQQAVGSGGNAVQVLVPMPLSPARLRQRGFNQAALLARQLAGLTGTTLDTAVLQRPVETARQADLTRDQRARNLRGVFMADPARRPALAGRRVALVDDVMTTGATTAEAARELLRAGAAAVEVWVVARTP